MSRRPDLSRGCRMFAALVVLDAVLPALLAVPPEPPDLVLSGEPLPRGAVARFGIPQNRLVHSRYPFAAGHSDEGSFRIAVGDGKDVRVWTWHAPTAHPPKHRFAGHAEEVTRLALSPDGRAAVSADKAGGVRVWDLATGETLLTTKTGAAVEDVIQTRPGLAVGPRGRFVFVPGKTGFAVWDTATGKRAGDGGAGRAFVTAGFSPDGKQLATADDKGKLDLWEAATAKHLGELAWAPKPPPKDEWPGLKLGPALRGFGDGLRHVIDPVSPEHDGGVLRIAFTADGKRVLAGGASVVRAWDLPGRAERWVTSQSRYFTTVGNATAWTTDSGMLSGMDVSADGRFVATADVSGTLRLMDGATGRELWSRPNAGGGVAFHPNGRWLATHAAGDAADLWDVRTGVRFAATGGHPGAARAVAFSPDGAYLAGFGDGHFLDVFDVARGRVSNRAFTRVGGRTGFGFTADGRYVVTGPGSHGQFAAVAVTPGPRVRLDVLNPESWHGRAPALCVDTRAPARIVSAGSQQVIFGEDIPSKKWVEYGDGTAETSVRLNDTPYRIALAPDVNRLVVGSGSSPARARVFDLKTGKEPVELEDDVPAYGVAVTPDGKLIAATTRTEFAGNRSHELRVWDGGTGKRKFLLEFGDTHGSAPAFSPDGKRIALGVGGEVVLVDVATGKEVGRVKGHRGNTWGVAFSPDGRRLASCGDDGQTLVWDVAAIR